MAEPMGFEDPVQGEKYERLVSQAKKEARNGNLEESISLLRKASEIRPGEKLTKNIKKLEEALASLTLDQEEDGFVDVCQSGLMLYGEMYEKLYEHQREGVAFLYSLYRDGRKGGILADDMGLGKTIQVIAFLSGMFDEQLIRSVLLVMPITLISNWTKEFAKWTPGLRVKVFHGISKAERHRNLERIQRKYGVLLTTYQMLLRNWQQLSSFGEKTFVWDYIILDEAHKIKTPSAKTTKCLQAIPSKNRVLLTGTPIQNNLKEFWALFDFACQGSLLGTMKTFKMEYEDPITRARAKDATPGEKALGLKISENLMSLIKPYFLRRSKDELQKKAKLEHQSDLPGDQSKDTCLTMPSLPRKNDFIVWVYLAPIQEEIYRKFVSLDHIKELLITTKSPLAELNILKKLCDHPRLLSARACSQLGLETSSYSEPDSEEIRVDGFSGPNTEHISDEILTEESGKLGFLLMLLTRLQEEGHRTLVFSQSRKMLDIIDRILTRRHFKFLRIDGTVTHLMEREKRISMFQKGKDYSVFLLTSQVGGVGLTLTAATRVIIFDPSWNPAVDAQAVDRVYRIGQENNVIIYRLITCGTVEEKIYRRQVFKDSLIRQSTGDKKNPYRYFTTQELRELFILEDFRCSTTQIQLQSLHANQRKTDIELEEHITYLQSLKIFGLSDHDLMYTHDAVQKDEPENEEAYRYIENKVQKAQELIQLESQLKEQEMESFKNMTEAIWLKEMESFTQPKKKPLKPSPNHHTLTPPVPVDPQSNNKPVNLVSDDDSNGEDLDIVNVSSKMASVIIEDLDEKEIVQDIPNTDVSPQIKEAKGAGVYQHEQTHDSSLVSSIAEAHSFSIKENCSPESRTASSDSPAIVRSTLNGIEEAYPQSLERSEISEHDLCTHGNEETHRYTEDKVQKAQELLQLESQLKEQEMESSIMNLMEPEWLTEMESSTQPNNKSLKPPNLTFTPPVPIEPKSRNESVVLVSDDDDDSSEDIDVVNVSSKVTSFVTEDLDEEEIVQDIPNMDVSEQMKEEATGASLYQHEQTRDSSLVSSTAEAHSFSVKENCSPESRTASSDSPAVVHSMLNGIQEAYPQSLERSEISEHDLCTHGNEETHRYTEDKVQKAQELLQLESQLKEQEMETSIKNVAEAAWLTEMESSTQPNNKSLKPSPNHTFMPPIPAEPKSRNESVIPESYDDDDNDEDIDVVNVSSKMASVIIEDLDEEEIVQDIPNMDVSPQIKEDKGAGVYQYEQTHDASLVSPTSEVNLFSNKRTCSPESKTVSHDPPAMASGTFNDVQMTSLHQPSDDVSFSKSQTDHNHNLSPMLSFSQAYSVSNVENCNPESKMVPLYPTAETNYMFNDVQKEPLQQSLQYVSNDAWQETETEMSLEVFTSPPGQVAVIDTAAAFQSQASKISNSSAMQESEISEIMLEIESLVDSPMIQGHFNLALKDFEDEPKDSLQSNALMGDTVNSGFQLKLDSACSTEAQSWAEKTRDSKSLQASNGIMGPLIADCSNPACDAMEDNSNASFGHKKKQVRRIVSDSEEDEEEGHLTNGLKESDHRKLSSLNSLHGVYMSTPKSDRCMTDLPFSPWVKIRGRRSTASRRSLADIVLDQVEDIAETMETSGNMTHDRSLQSSPAREETQGYSGQEWESSEEMLDLEDYLNSSISALHGW